MDKKQKLKQSEYQNFDQRFIFIPLIPKQLAKKIFYTLYHHAKAFLYFKISYLKLWFWFIFHFDRIIFHSFIRLIPVSIFISSGHPDLIYAHYPSKPAIFAFLMSKLLNKRFGVILHSHYPYKKYTHDIFPKSSFIIVKADFVKKDILKRYYRLSPKQIKVLPWGIDTEYFCRRISTNTKNEIFHIVTISRYVEQKGLIYAIKACEILKKKNIKFLYKLYGYGEEKQKIQKYIKDYNFIDLIKVNNQINYSEKLRHILAQANMFILPSIVDSKGEVDVLPNVLFEAMAMDLPIITTSVNGMNEVIQNGYNGFLVKEHDPHSLAKKIIQVMNLSDLQRKKIGMNARNTIIKRFDKNDQGKKFVAFLKSMTSGDKS